MSGAKNCPETPRQKMIGMMYLVLTAMLALNVSSEILNGFSLVDNSLRNTITSANKRNTALYEDFDYLYQRNPTKVKEWLDKAQKVQKNADELYQYIENFKYQILKIADGKKADKNSINIINKENIDAAGEYALTKKNGKKLRENIQKYRNFLLETVANNPTKQELYSTMFETNGGSRWEKKLFESMPVSAAITILTKYQSDIRSAEAEAVEYLKSQTDALDFRVNKIQAYVVPNSKYIIQGSKYSANIILSATDSTKKYNYYINNQKLSKGTYEFIATKTGTFNYTGHIQIQGNDGKEKTYQFSENYTVGKPTATISNKDLNVVYRGIDNQFSISVPGIPAEKVNVKVEGGTAKKGADGNYIIRANRDGEITIIVTTNIEGKEQIMGSSHFRVKYLPDPKAYLSYTDAGGVPRTTQEGRMTRKQLQTAKLIASYGEDQLVKAKFNITSFTMLTAIGVATSNSEELSNRQRTQLKQLEGGDIITFKNIKAVGPDGKTRSLGIIQVEL